LTCAPTWDPTPLPKERYDFRLISVARDPDHTVMGTFRFRLNGGEPIRLRGFGFEDGTMGLPGDNGHIFRPRSPTFKRKEASRWVDVPVGYCGFGVWDYAIQPNRDYIFRVPLWPFVEKGTEGIVGLWGPEVEVESTPFDTAGIRKLAARAD